MSDVARPTTRRRWLAVGLVLSLALNAFLIGAAGTDLLRFLRPHGRDSDRPFRFELRWLEGRLPAEGLAKVQAALVALDPDADQRFARLKQLRQELGTLVAVAEPDRAAIDAKLADIRKELDQMLVKVQGASTDALLALPPDMRDKLAAPAPVK
jgi:uncharacterized membrane protein